MCSVLIRVGIIFFLVLTGCGGSSTGDPSGTDSPEVSQTDTDGDNVPDNVDSDDDNDGLADDVDPEPRALIKKGRVSATFFTEDPASIIGPIKVLFAIDCSLTMLDTDPKGRRITAVREFLHRFNTEVYPTVSFGIVLWSDTIVDLTLDGDGNPGFTRSTEALNRVLDNTSLEASTDYLEALSAIETMVANDMRKTLDRNPEAKFSRSQYIVCFLSDGAPNREGGLPSDGEIVQRVEAIKSGAERYGAGRFIFHTFFLSTHYRDANGDFVAEPDPRVNGGKTAVKILSDMAGAGNGNYLDFPNAAAISFADFESLRPVSQYKIKFIVAYNHMVRPHITSDTLVMDSDGDGLSDAREVQLGTDPGVRDTDDDGLNDGFEMSIQTNDGGNGNPEQNPLTADSSCPPPANGMWPDQDGDGLTDCEERVGKTLLSWADADNDAVPDGIEVAAGTNPLEDQYPEDTDLDTVLDVFEVREHTNVLVNDPILRERHGYHYSITDHGSPDPVLQPDLSAGIRRYTIDISNIGLMDTSGAAADDIFDSTDGMHPGDNAIRIYISQVPKDRPNDPAVFRMAQVIINYNDETHDIVLTPDDFNMLP